MKTKTKSWINAILLVITLIVNGMGAFGLINDLSQKEIIKKVYITLQILKVEGDGVISFLFWLSCALNVVWIVSFSYNLIGLSSVFIFAFLIVMVLIVKRIGKIQTKGRWLLPITFGLYSGWLFIATVVNIAAWLVKIEWNRFGIAAELWGVIILFIAVGLTLMVLLTTKNAIFPIPIAWAYFGIYGFLLAPEGFQGKYGLLQNVALIGIVLLVGLSLIQFYRNQYNVMQ